MYRNDAKALFICQSFVVQKEIKLAKRAPFYKEHTKSPIGLLKNKKSKLQRCKVPQLFDLTIEIKMMWYKTN
jgi:hypothetical protein